MDESVKEFLYDLGLEQYNDIFITKGFDAESDMGNIQEDDLDCMGITSVSHRQLLLTAAFHYTPSEEHKLYKWLREHQLDYYYINFVRSELTDFADLEKLNLPDETVYDELEIVLPGHKKRLEKAVHQLRLKRSSSVSPEEPLAVGKWGKPAALLDAKYDFLCVEAVIASTKPIGSSKTMDFMVDSGSDVVTLREEILEGLDLELLGTVRSKGVHASKEKRLYKAHLSIGHFTIEIEVMPESYDSLGSRVIRHFRHFIDGNRHVWLPGNLNELATPANAQAQIQNTDRTNLESSSSTSVIRDRPTNNVEDYTSISAKSVELNKCDPSIVHPSALKKDSEMLISAKTGTKDSSVFDQYHHTGSVQPSLRLSHPTHQTEEQDLFPLLRDPDGSRPTERDCFLIDSEPTSIAKHSNIEAKPSSEKKIEQSSSVPSKRLKTSPSSTVSSCSETNSGILLKRESASSLNESNLYMFKREQHGMVTTETDLTRTENSSMCIATGYSPKVSMEPNRPLSPERSPLVIGSDFSGIVETQPQILGTDQIGFTIIEQETPTDETVTASSVQTIKKSEASVSQDSQVSDPESSTLPDKSSTIQILSRLCGASVNKCENSSVKNAANMCYCLPLIGNEEIPKFNCDYMQSSCLGNNSYFSRLCNSSNISTRTNVRKRKLIEKPEVGSVHESPLPSVSITASPCIPTASRETDSLTSSTQTVTSLANFTLSSTSDIIPSKRKCQVVCGDTGVSLDYNLLLNKALYSSKLQTSNSSQKADTLGKSDNPEFTSETSKCKVHSNGIQDGFYSDTYLPSSLCLDREALSSAEEKHI